MKNVKLGKILLYAASAVMITASAASLGACTIETAHPEAEITYEFNGETYSVKYTLYRNLRPHTVRHFIELSDEGYYDNTVIHNYDTSDWFGGMYTYDQEQYTEKSENANQMAEYFADFSKEDAYVQLYADGVLSKTVFKFAAYNPETEKIEDTDEYVPTLMGEFYNNIHQESENDPLSSEFGCLKTYYYEKSSVQKVYVTPTKDQTIMADYKSNCTTSLFAVQTGTSSSYTRATYSVFAKLASIDEFENLIEDINDYIRDEHGGTKSDFYNETVVHVDNSDAFTDKSEVDRGIEQTFKSPKTPIIIKSVKITKY